MVPSTISCFLLCARHWLSRCCTSALMSSTSCVASPLRCHCDASKNQLSFPPLITSARNVDYRPPDIPCHVLLLPSTIKLFLLVSFANMCLDIMSLWLQKLIKQIQNSLSTNMTCTCRFVVKKASNLDIAWLALEKTWVLKLAMALIFSYTHLSAIFFPALFPTIVIPPN